MDWNEAAERVNGQEVYVWAAIDVDTGELPAMKALCRVVHWSRSAMDALLFLSRALEARANKPVFVVEGGPWYSWAFRELGLEHCRGAFGDRSGVERSFGSLRRRTSAFFKDINAGRSRIASLDRIVNMFFVYYNGPSGSRRGWARVVGGDRCCEVIPLI